MLLLAATPARPTDAVLFETATLSIAVLIRLASSSASTNAPGTVCVVLCCGVGGVGRGQGA